MASAVPPSSSAVKILPNAFFPRSHHHPSACTSLRSKNRTSTRVTCAAGRRSHALPSAGDGNGCNNGGGGGGGDDSEGGGNGDGSDGGGNGDGSDGNRGAALFARPQDWWRADLVAAVEAPQLLCFESLLTDDVFPVRTAAAISFNAIAKTAAEYEKRGENFIKEIDIVIADAVKAIATNFTLVYLPTSISLQPPLGNKIALVARLYLYLNGLVTIASTGPKFFTVGASASPPSQIDAGVPQAPIITRKAFIQELDDKAVEKKWSSYFEVKAEVSAGTTPAKATALWSYSSSGESQGNSSGQSRENGTA
ncbi:hypothetical protein VPH35_047835 [Triticum aestivum]|uniref:Uncharacterized protein n=1 Tax=Triticum aestivum TaxID=4565 RepID=A0A3B6ER30_WHEAT|nr:protein RETICULATA-RELATED 4, chloroplastic-like [Triticum aestivum]